MPEQEGYDPQLQIKDDIDSGTEFQGKGAEIGIQLAAAEQKAVAEADSQEARLGLKIAERQVDKLDVSRPVGNMVSRTLESMAKRVAKQKEKLAKKAAKSKLKKEARELKAATIRDKWKRIRTSENKTDVVKTFAAGVDSDIKVSRGVIKPTSEFFQKGVDAMKTWYQESHAILQSGLETRRGSTAEIYNSIANGLTAAAESMQSNVDQIKLEQAGELGGNLDNAKTAREDTNAAENRAGDRFDRSLVDGKAIGDASKINAEVSDTLQGKRDIVQAVPDQIAQAVNREADTN